VVTLGCGQVVRTRLLVGADGPNSVVRRDNGLESTGTKYNQTAVVATLNLSLPSPVSEPYQCRAPMNTDHEHRP
jgi:ubiquinone biosynthesis monooxygenase Coq6